MSIRIIYIIFLFLVLASCDNKDQSISTDLVKTPQTAGKSSDKIPMPVILIDQDFFDFGEMNQNESVSTEFKLKNIGEESLLIRSAKGSCGCTVPEWPREPVRPGEYAVIKVTFNSGKREGIQNKTVTLITNAIPSAKVLTIKGIVLVSKE